MAKPASARGGAESDTFHVGRRDTEAGDLCRARRISSEEQGTAGDLGAYTRAEGHAAAIGCDGRSLLHQYRHVARHDSVYAGPQDLWADAFTNVRDVVGKARAG